MSSWLILYRDGATFSSDDGEPWQAPAGRVQAVFCADDLTGAVVERSSSGHWVWKDGRWFGVDVEGYWQYKLLHLEGPRIVIYGEEIPDEEWRGRMTELIEHHLGVCKSAWYRREYEPGA